MRILPVLFLAAFSQSLAACVTNALDGETDLYASNCGSACSSPSPKNSVDSQIVTIRQDQGGLIIGYSMAMMKLRDSGTKVKFAGRCDSACTIYLALPPEQTCITRGAMFGFHAPSAATREASLIAQDYLLESYPDWVKAWITSRGGLSGKLITMDYAYASQFLDRCGQVLT